RSGHACGCGRCTRLGIALARRHRRRMARDRAAKRSSVPEHGPRDLAQGPRHNVPVPAVVPVTIPASEVIEFRYARLDPSRLMPMRVRTARSGTVQVVPRMSGLLDMLVELRRLNPQLKLP